MLARPLCGCLGTVNVAVVGELSPNTGRASPDSEMPGFHQAHGRGLQLAIAHCRRSRWAKLQRVRRVRLYFTKLFFISLFGGCLTHPNY